MDQLVFATRNEHKLKEIARAVEGRIEIVSLNDLGFYEDIAETEITLEGNARLKSSFIHHKFKINCFADDTGLEIEALNNRPGVFSARYAGENHDHEKNMDKVLGEMADVRNRKARFRTVISLIWNHHHYFFEGIVRGQILMNRKGSRGFGYDPIFQPDGYQLSFAQMALDEKNKISHRGIAVQKLVNFLMKQ